MFPQASSASKYDIFEEEHKFDQPIKLIKTPHDMKMWEKSEAYFEYLGFILAVSTAVKGKSNKQGSEHVSENIEKVMEVLTKIDALIDETPPIQQPQRFGNKAFRDFYAKLKDNALSWLQNCVPHVLYRAIPEIMMYMVEGFGNPTRIDYGTGHEISFCMFLMCLCKLSFLDQADNVAIGCKIFPRYLELARKLQMTYRMEPAGSHGVWSLDDFQFVPFIWGSSQLIDHPKLEPRSFLKTDLVEMFADDYMFFSCIKYINQVKTGPFAEHSNQLWSISAVPNWTKVNSGLMRMYKVEKGSRLSEIFKISLLYNPTLDCEDATERSQKVFAIMHVLGKFPVVQHILFGSLLTLKPAEENKEPVQTVHKRPLSGLSRSDMRLVEKEEKVIESRSSNLLADSTLDIENRQASI